jgi:hypothetical protein
MWFNNWENQHVALGLAPRKNVAKVIDISAEQLMQILNFDLIALTLNGSGTAAGGRPQAISYNPHLPFIGKVTLKEGATSTMITGSSVAGEAIPPHFQFATTTQHKDNKQSRMEAAAFFPNLRGKFVMKEPRYLGVSIRF